jgi:hypothetical protein
MASKRLLKLQLLFTVCLFALSVCSILGYIARFIPSLTLVVWLLLALLALMGLYFHHFYKDARELVYIGLAVVAFAGVVVCLP